MLFPTSPIFASGFNHDVIFDRPLRLRAKLVRAPLARQVERHLDEIADDLIDVAAVETDLGELGRFHLRQAAVGQARSLRVNEPKRGVGTTLRNGACESFEMRRAISVLPHPVGPIIKIFLGMTSACG